MADKNSEKATNKNSEYKRSEQNDSGLIGAMIIRRKEQAAKPYYKDNLAQKLYSVRSKMYGCITAFLTYF